VNVRFGDVFYFQIENGNFCYAQVLEEPECAFFSLESKKPDCAESAIVSNLLFRAWVHKSSYKQWSKACNFPVAASLAEKIPRFKKNALNGRPSIYIDGKETPATFDEVQGLECAAVWEHEHIISRISDQLSGKGNSWLASLQPRKNG